MFSFPCFPFGGPFVYFLYTLGSPRVLFGGLIHFVVYPSNKKDEKFNLIMPNNFIVHDENFFIFLFFGQFSIKE